MFAKLTALVSGSAAFAYDVGEAFPSGWGSWTHHRGTIKEDGSEVSVFKVTAPSSGDGRLAAARHGVKRLRTLRHPNVLAFKDTVEVEEKGTVTLYLITEAVKPLELVLNELNLSGEQRHEYLAMGLNHIASAISFLNNDCKLIHGNLCMAAVGVTEKLDWKLHGFDLLSEHASIVGSPLHTNIWMVRNQYKPGELAKGEWEAVPQNPPWAVDAWGLGCLIQEVFSGRDLRQAEDLRRTDPIPEALLTDYQRLLGSKPSKRLNPAKVAKSQFVHNQTVDVVNFLENLAVKESVEKDTFFRKLPNMLPSLPAPVAERKVLPMLSSALEYGGAPAVALSCIMQIGKQMGEEEFGQRVIPVISRLFSSTDRAIRRSLLENTDRFANHLTEKLVETEIYPQLQTGFSDSNAYLREMTLKSMRSLAPKLSQRTINNSLLKFLAKLQVDQEPTIRANTTVLLGNIAKLMGEASCKRVLLNAFSRSLRDTFPGAKVAGLRALAATIEFHGPEDIAARVVPMLGPLAVDAVEDVRSAALDCLDLFVKKLKTNAANMTKSASEQAAAGAADGRQETWSAAAGGSYLSWAVSSLGLSKTGQADGEAPSSSPSPPTSSSAATSPTTHATSQSSPKGAAWGDAAESRAEERAAASPQGGREGWDDDLEAFEEDEEEVAARARLSRAGGSRSTGRRAGAAAAAAAASPTGGSEGWDDGLDSVFEDMGINASLPGAAPARPTQRKAAGGKKAMKLGAQKLKGKVDFGDL
ncbi:unnamed protein product [Ostreobium quekettii]|uniref:Protein kinase domain-containing protein n=1 Tax=Ostreobium quekettii TaxID=121088 RepID=A0A8S1IY74_9CHLO|nr:unnamed protein product [Ostreobium quekettii]|eukprot:evm.model.scf_153.3 EVM.evm.TU.scf_153.3   scf_153:28072-31659(-)